VGAYYECTIKTSKRYDTHEYGIGLKLMEHSYLRNNYVNAMMSIIKNKTASIGWVCDYYEGDWSWNNSEEVSTEEDYGDINYVVNKTKKVYIDFEKYEDYFVNSDEPSIIHPVPLLIKSNNDPMGGGDYHKEDERIGTWFKDELYTTEYIPYSDYQDVTLDCIFMEN